MIEMTVPWLPFRARAMTLWPLILYKPAVRRSVCIQVHERYHWYDQKRWWVLPWFVMYGFWWLCGYGLWRPIDKHPLEREAYRLGRRCEELQRP